MTPSWFRKRGYGHFDSPPGNWFVSQAEDPKYVAQHAWLPLLHYSKETKRYVHAERRIKKKIRPIKFASHRDSVILAKYAHDLNKLLESEYQKLNIDECVIAYRKLGRSNYDFSAEARNFALQHKICKVIGFDVSGFFDNLDHLILKGLLRRVLGENELPADWYVVFRHVTRYRFVDRDELQRIPRFAQRMKTRPPVRIASIQELLQEGVDVKQNSSGRGIPQGTPISASFSNLYMIDVDTKMASACKQVGALYRRYSDDILLICAPKDAPNLENQLKSAILDHKLHINDEKTETCEIYPGSIDTFQYLGFNNNVSGSYIRPSSLSRQHRKMRWALKKIELQVAEKGNSSSNQTISTKKLRRRFWPTGARNFSRYARRAAKSIGDRRIVLQALRLERMMDREIKRIIGRAKE